MPKRKVDNSDKKVYDAEDACGVNFSTFHDLAGAQWFVDRIVRSAWWRKRCDIIKVAVSYHANTLTSHGGFHKGDPESGFIKLGVCGFDTCTALHELSHIITPADHSPEWARTYLNVLEHWAGKITSSKMEASFVEHGVQITPK